MAILDEIRTFWDDDAATYDDAPGHHPTSPAAQAAWTAALESLLPAPPARVLDGGAGTGFLSLIAARLGHRVTALDLSGQMLDKLRAAAAAEGLDVAVTVGPAHEVAGEFDVVMERHVLWTLPDPAAALRAWRAAAPDGALVAVESLWGDADPLEAWRGVARRATPCGAGARRRPTTTAPTLPRCAPRYLSGPAPTPAPWPDWWPRRGGDTPGWCACATSNGPPPWSSACPSVSSGSRRASP